MAKPLPRSRWQDEAASVSPEVPPPDGGDPEPEEIARLAYQYWQQRGCPTGTPEEDWFRAEQEIKLRQQERVQKGDAH
jgi:hypothetical protein